MKSHLLVPAMLAITACTADSGTATVPATSEFDMVAGQRQPFADRLVDSNDSPLEGHITWTSSNPAAATVDANGVVTGIHTGTANVTGISDHSSAAVLITVNQGGMVDADSGVTYSDDRSFWVTRFAGTFGLGALTFTKLPTPSLANAIPGTAWGLGVGNFVSGANILVTIHYDPAQLPAGTNPMDLQFRALSGAPLGGNFTDTVAHTVTMGASPAGYQMVLVVEPVQIDSVVLSIPDVWDTGKLHVGEQTDVSVQPFGSSPYGVGIRWQSSDPTTITVTNGSLIALRPGVVVIRADMDGVIGTLAVTAVP